MASLPQKPSVPISLANVIAYHEPTKDQLPVLFGPLGCSVLLSENNSCRSRCRLGHAFPAARQWLHGRRRAMEERLTASAFRRRLPPALPKRSRLRHTPDLRGSTPVSWPFRGMCKFHNACRNSASRFSLRIGRGPTPLAPHQRGISPAVWAQRSSQRLCANRWNSCSGVRL